MSTRLDEKLYRQILDQTYANIDRAFDDVDPDAAEVNVSQGTLTVMFDGGLRLMLTPQPSPRQLWVAFRDRAWHFDYDPAGRRWLDDRGQGIDALKLIEDTTREMAGIAITIEPLSPGGTT
ncbi:MAG TPA: frataxin domain-containing protein [Polyangia bacterium]|jgi:CyaY protein|nr:frataxin domain-containing protein [Polyangia bacterium]